MQSYILGFAFYNESWNVVAHTLFYNENQYIVYSNIKSK